MIFYRRSNARSIFVEKIFICSILFMGEPAPEFQFPYPSRELQSKTNPLAAR
jgi:hypothetical protein